MHAVTVNVNLQPTSYREWEDYRNADHLARSRDASMSTSVLPHHQTITSQQNASHFATLRRHNSAKSQKPPEPAPPLPPRNHSSMSQSVFDLSQIPFGMPPWCYPPGYPLDPYHQQQMMMGYPGQLKKTPSNSSFTGSTPQFMGWPPYYPPNMMMDPGLNHPMNSYHFDSGNESEPAMSMTYGNQQQPPPLPPRPMTPQGPVVRRKTGSSSRRSEAPDESRSVAVMRGRERSPHPNQMAVRGNTAPPPEVHQESEEDSYLTTSNRVKRDRNEEEDNFVSIEVTTEPEGPWTCEHCTFINPKSTKICTVCCKTPSLGYRVMQVKGKGKGSQRSPVVKSKLKLSKGTNSKYEEEVINVEEKIEKGRFSTAAYTEKCVS